MYAIVEFEGCQFKVSPSQPVNVPRIKADVGSEVVMDRVLAVSDEGRFGVWQPYVPGCTVKARILEHFRGPKVIVFKYKRRKDYRRKMGHRTNLTRLSIEEVSTS